MPRASRPRKAYRPQPTVANAVARAINGVRRLAPQDTRAQTQLLRNALQSFRLGQHCELHWRSLADCANVTETLADMGIGSGDQAARVIHAAQRALADVAERRQRQHTWALRYDEHEALQWLIALHEVQLQTCDYSELCQALDRTRIRITQARAGNAPEGAVVVHGEIR